MGAKLQKAFGMILALVMVAALGYGAWQLVVVFIAAITAVSPEVMAAIVGAMATILAGVAVVLLSQAHERKRAAEEAHRLKKVEIYKEFIEMVSKMLGSSNEHLEIKGPEMPELINYLFRYHSEILLWGSPRVIKAQIEFEAVSGNVSGDEKASFKAVNEIYLAIREDIGLSNSGLTNLELVKLYLDKEARGLLR